MKPTLTDKRFIGDEWTFERKLDGIRVLAFKRGREVRLLSRLGAGRHGLRRRRPA